MRFLSIFCITLSTILGFGTFANAQINYAVSAISPTLTENADMVVRNYKANVEIVSPSKVVVNYSYAYTILKESAVRWSKVILPYNKTRKLSNISVSIYDANGKRVKKIKADEILDFSAIDEGTMFSDSRQKQIDPKYQAYPFTIEVDFTMTNETAFGLPNFRPFFGYNISIENYLLKVTTDKDYLLRFKEFNGVKKAEITELGNKKSYVWKVENFSARNPEYFSPASSETYPYVYIEPSTFEFDGYKGNLSDWQQFGKFSSDLLVGKDELPQATITKIKELVKDCKTDEEKIKAVYEYSQKKNRYISIQVGIGGYQPFDASTVDRLSYGDCKALSNYVVALLKVAGIKGYYTLIEADELATEIDPSFATNAFNHAVVCVPLANDTVWLECTNPHIACGFFGTSTYNRKALLVDGINSRLVQTKKAKENSNIEQTNGEFILFENGTATSTLTKNYAGLAYEDGLRYKLMDNEDRKKAIQKLIQIPNFQLEKYQLDEVREGPPRVELTTSLYISDFASKMGNRLIMKLNQHNPHTFIPPYARKREADLLWPFDFIEADTIVYNLPKGYKVENLPQPIVIESEFGYYKATCSDNKNQLLYYREFKVNDGRYKPEKYNQFRDFLEKVAAADLTKCTLIKL